jgi:hypothetical protein
MHGSVSRVLFGWYAKGLHLRLNNIRAEPVVSNLEIPS